MMWFFQDMTKSDQLRVPHVCFLNAPMLRSFCLREDSLIGSVVHVGGEGRKGKGSLGISSNEDNPTPLSGFRLDKQRGEPFKVSCVSQSDADGGRRMQTSCRIAMLTTAAAVL